MTKSNFTGRIIFLGLLCSLTLFICVLFFMFFTSEITKGRIIVEHRAETLIFELIHALTRPGTTFNISDYPEIKGFGMYTESGSMEFSYGNTPSSLDKKTAASKTTGFLYKKDSLIVVRHIGEPPVLGMNRPDMMQRPPDTKKRDVLIAYLVIDIREFQHSERLNNISLMSIPLIIIVLAILLGFFYLKNQQYRRRLEEQNRLAQLGEAARTLSHEIKNPLSAIKIKTSLLKKALPEEYYKDLRIIDEEVDRINILSTKTRDFLKEPKGNPEKIDVLDFISTLIQRFEYSIKVISESKDPIYVFFDRTNFRSVLENCVKNAIESYKNPDNLAEGERVEIRIKTGLTQVEISILDRGEGISKENMNKLFNPFFSTKVHGSGIGLSVTKRMIEVMGGKINVSNRKDGGTAAQIILPRAKG